MQSRDKSRCDSSSGASTLAISSDTADEGWVERARSTAEESGIPQLYDLLVDVQL